MATFIKVAQSTRTSACVRQAWGVGLRSLSGALRSSEKDCGHRGPKNLFTSLERIKVLFRKVHDY